MNGDDLVVVGNVLDVGAGVRRIMLDETDVERHALVKLATAKQAAALKAGDAVSMMKSVATQDDRIKAVIAAANSDTPSVFVRGEDGRFVAVGFVTSVDTTRDTFDMYGLGDSYAQKTFGPMRATMTVSLTL